MSPNPATARQTKPRPAPKPQERSKPTSARLAVVTKNDSRKPTPKHHIRLVTVIAAIALSGALLFIAVSQAMVASQQVRLSNLTGELNTAVSTNEDLQLTKAQLASPSRILKIAESKLAMVAPAPSSVVYLQPVNPGPTLSSPTKAK